MEAVDQQVAEADAEEQREFCSSLLRAHRRFEDGEDATERHFNREGGHMHTPVLKTKRKTASWCTSDPTHFLWMSRENWIKGFR